MRKPITFLILVPFLLQASSVFTQPIWLGVKGGISIPNISGGNDELSRGYTSRLAANFGIQAEYGLHDRFSLVAELNYAGQGGQRKGLQPVTGLPPQYAALVPPGTYLYADFKNKAILDYLELPVMARLTWGNSFLFYVNAGPYLGYLLHAKQKISGTSTIYDNHGVPITIQGQAIPARSFDSTIDVTSSIRRFNVGVTGGGGLAWPFSPASRLFLDARFEYGFINIQRNSADGHNNTGNILISLGYARRLK